MRQDNLKLEDINYQINDRNEINQESNAGVGNSNEKTQKTESKNFDFFIQTEDKVSNIF